MVFGTCGITQMLTGDMSEPKSHPWILSAALEKYRHSLEHRTSAYTVAEVYFLYQT
jgi:hypothetical protein